MAELIPAGSAVLLAVAVVVLAVAGHGQYRELREAQRRIRAMGERSRVREQLLVEAQTDVATLQAELSRVRGDLEKSRRVQGMAVYPRQRVQPPGEHIRHRRRLDPDGTQVITTDGPGEC